MGRKFFSLLLAGWLSALGQLLWGQGAGLATLPPEAEARLFSLEDLGPVDFTPKRVAVEVYSTPLPELEDFRQLLPPAWEQVRSFYGPLGVELELIPGAPRPGALDPRRHLRVEALTRKEWLARTFAAFQVAPPYQARFLKVCRDKYAFAHLHLSTIHLDYQRFRQEIAEPGVFPRKRREQLLANLLIHELGHLFGLYHAHEFVNDPIPEYLPDRRTPNFMSQHLTGLRPLGFVEFQKRLVHSYLGGGKVFRQYQAVAFDPLRYLELIKRHNGYRESSPRRASQENP